MLKDKIKKIIFYSLIIFCGLGATVVFYFMLKSETSAEPVTRKIFLILRPFIIGGVLAYIMKSTCNFFERIYTKGLLKSGKRTEKKASKVAAVLSLITTYVVWAAAITLLIVLIARPLVESAKNLAVSLLENVPIYAEKAINFVSNKLSGHPQVLELFESSIENIEGKIQNWIQTELPGQIKNISTQLILSVVDIVVLIKDIFIGLVVSVLLLSGRKTLAAKSQIFVKCLFKEKTADAIIGEFKFADKMFSGFLEGKVIDSAIIGVLYYIALLIMQVPYAPLIAVVCGITNIIPIFGPFIGAVPSALIILSAGQPIKVLWFIIFVCVMQFIDGYIIDPHIVGGNIKISSFSVLFAVILFGGLWGFAGLLVGVPVFAVIYDIIKKVLKYMLEKKGLGHLIDEYNAKFKKVKSNDQDSSRSDSQNNQSGTPTPGGAQTDEEKNKCNDEKTAEPVSQQQ